MLTDALHLSKSPKIDLTCYGDLVLASVEISPPSLNTHTQQLKDNSIPDVRGKSWNFLILHTNELAGPKLLITDSVREAA